MEEGENMDKSKTREIALRIVSVLIALALWIYVASIDNPTTSTVVTNIPVTLVNTSALSQSNYILVSYQNSISLNIEGRKKDILSVKPGDFKAEANLASDYRVKGQNPVLVVIKGWPKDIKIPNQPLYINVELDEMVQKSFPVTVQVDGAPKSGYANLAATVKPTEVLIKGASSIIDRVNSVVVKPDIKNASSDLNVSLPVQILDKSGKPVYDVVDTAPKVDISPKMVDVTVPIQRSKDVPVNIITTGKLPAGVFKKDITANPSKVTIVGPEAAVNGVNYIDTAPVSLDGVTLSTARQVKLDIPQGVTVSGNIQAVNVNINVETNISKTLSVPVNFINLPDGLKAEPLTNTISVTLIGQESIISNITAADISAVVDLGSAPAEDGEYEFTVKAVPPSGIDMKDVIPQKIKVKITKKQG